MNMSFMTNIIQMHRSQFQSSIDRANQRISMYQGIIDQQKTFITQVQTELDTFNKSVAPIEATIVNAPVEPTIVNAPVEPALPFAKPEVAPPVTP